ncbi:hypothetical protein ACT4ML_10095 [Natrinema sp. LN54]|uniref:hypothetical protein n=1 Tax=Natrinema sp. LN54 TaxID=3458705 RepID=UPI004035EC03
MVDRPSAVTWSRSASASTAGRLCRYVQVGFFGGLAVLVAGFVIMGVVLSVASGAYEGVAVFALLLLIGGPFSLLYLLPLLEDRTTRSAVRNWLVRAGYDRLSLSRLATSVLVGAVAIIGVIATVPKVLLAGFVVIPVGTGTVTWLLTSRGQIDPETGTVRVNGQSFTLEELAAVRAFRISAVETVVLRPSYATKTRGVTAPPSVVMPRDAYENAKPPFDAATRETESTDQQSRVERVVLVVFGVGALAGAVGATSLGLERGGDALVILLYVALLAGCFGVVFLALAVRRP